MSFLKTKVLVSIFTAILLISQPYLAFAQINWTPPDGPPLNNNTPAPINVGAIDQSKSGAIFVTKPAGSTGLAVPFANSLFGFYSSQLGSYPADVSIYGNLIYRYPGQIIPPLGTVLSPDVNGVAKWTNIRDLLGDSDYNLAIQKYGTQVINRPQVLNFVENGDYGLLDVVQTSPISADIIINSEILSGLGGGDTLPDGNNTGDILVWNDNTQEWEVTNLNLQNGDVLVWNSTTNEWENISITNVTGELPPGTSGQTLVHNGTNWVAVNNLTHSQTSVDGPYDFDMIPDGFTTTVSNDIFMTDTMKTLLGRPNEGVVSIMSPNASVNSQNVNFVGSIGEQQTLNLRSDAIKIIGPFQNNEINPAQGKFLFSKDDEGSVAWNEYLEYEDIVYNVDQHIDAIKIMESDDPDRKTGFANYGDYTYLQNWLEVDGLTFLNGNLTVGGESLFNDDVTVSDDGDLFLVGIDTLPPAQMDVNGNPVSTLPVDHLCITNGARKVVLCDAADPKPISSTAQYTETFGPSTTNVTFPRPNQAPGDVTVKSCGAGGGGGGGGRGWEDGSENGHGGGGGGGGGKGECSTTIIDPSDGDQLTWNIGTGGSGGSPGNIDVVFDPAPASTHADTAATYGQPGGGTQVWFEGNQIANLSGGQGGYGGANASGTGPGVGGSGGSTDQAIATALWHKGGNGQIGSANATEMGQGGYGGRGEDNVTGQGGNGGNAGQPYGGGQFGGVGMQGAPGYGGGGGGGGAGKWYDYQYTLSNQQTEDNAIRNHGGWGANGGSGYVELTYTIYVEEPAPVTEWVREVNGTFTFDPSTLPAGTTGVTIEVWGAGGGGGPLNYNDLGGKGGGAGAYAKLENYPMTPNSADVVVTVGNGGNAGTGGGSNGFGGSSFGTNGTSGTQSSFGTVLIAGGGTFGTWNTPGTGSTFTSGASQSVSGLSGSATDGGAGGQAFDGSGTTTAGDGGRGALDGFVTNTAAGPGQDGRVRVSW